MTDLPPRTFLNILAVTAAKGLGSLLSLVTAVGIANLFGAGAGTDTYFFARRVTSNLAMALERAFHLLQVPPLVHYARSNGLQALRLRLQKASGTVLLLSLAVTLPAFIMAGPLVRLMAPGFSETQLPDAVFYFRILLLTLPISAVTALSGATMNALRSFTLPVMVRLLPRIAVVLALALVPLGFGFSALSVAVVLGTALMGLLFRLALRRTFDRSDTAAPATSAGPSALPQAVFSYGRIAAMLIAQAHILGASWIDLGFASTTGEGSVAAYDFAQRLVNMTPGLVTNSVVLVYYTEFATVLADRDTDTFRRLVRDALRLSLFFILPIGISLSFLSGPLVSGLLQHGHFSSEDALRTATVVTVLAVLLPVNAALGSVVSAIFADSRLPHLRIILVTTVVAIAVRVLFDLWAVPRFGIIAVPIGVVLAMTVLFIQLYVWLSFYLGALVKWREAWPFLALVAGSALCGLAVWAVQEAVLPAEPTRSAALFSVALASLAGAVTFLATAAAFGLSETRMVTQRLSRLVRKIRRK